MAGNIALARQLRPGLLDANFMAGIAGCIRLRKLQNKQRPSQYRSISLVLANRWWVKNATNGKA